MFISYTYWLSTLLELIKNAVSIGSENTKSKFESPVLKSNVLKLKPEAAT